MTHHRIEEELIGDRIFIPNRQGQEERFEVLFAFMREDTGDRYMMVSLCDPPENEGKEEQDVYAFRYREEGDRLVLFFIEDDTEWNIVEKMFNMFLQKEEPSP